MTQTEKTEALRELRHWFALPTLTAEQKGAVNKELSKILGNDVHTAVDSVEKVLALGGELHHKEYVILKDDTTWYSLVNAVTSETERSLDYKLLIEKILKEKA